MSFIKISAAQAAAIRGNYGPFNALDPIPLDGSTDYILTDAVLTDPAFASVRTILQAMPTYPQWQSGEMVSVGAIREYDGLLRRCLQAHTTQADWTPDVAPALWVITHRDGEVPAWWQPTGSHDTWPLNAKVLHGGRVWLSLTNANTYEPGVIGTWRDRSSPPMWVQPSGAVGLWQVNDVATHNGQTWRNTSANNSFAPGVFGWVLV